MAKTKVKTGMAVDNTAKIAEITGVVNELQADYDESLALYDMNLKALDKLDPESPYYRVTRSSVQEGEWDSDTAMRQAIDLLIEYRKSLGG